MPALLATILLFMDQQITAVIVNRKEHKLNVSKPNHSEPEKLKKYRQKTREIK